MSNAIARLAAYAVLLVAVFTGAALLGDATDPDGSTADEGHGAAMRSGDGSAHGDGDGGAAKPAPGDAHGDDHAAGAAAAAALPGLQVEQDGYRLVVEQDRLPRTSGNGATPLRFAIVDRDGEAVTGFEVEHEKRLHLIVVRRDLSGFQHLHPEMDADGTWSADVKLARPGTWRVFADFKREGEQRTLGADVQVPGAFEPAAPLKPQTVTRTDGGLTVSLDESGDAHAGEEQQLDFEVRDGDRVVDDRLEPYLGARGHLVALRERDLAYLHTHPDGDRLAFATSWPSAGDYRLFVQFKYDGRIHTATFAKEVPR